MNEEIIDFRNAEKLGIQDIIAKLDSIKATDITMLYTASTVRGGVSRLQRVAKHLIEAEGYSVTMVCGGVQLPSIQHDKLQIIALPSWRRSNSLERGEYITLIGESSEVYLKEKTDNSDTLHDFQLTKVGHSYRELRNTLLDGVLSNASSSLMLTEGWPILNEIEHALGKSFKSYAEKYQIPLIGIVRDVGFYPEPYFPRSTSDICEDLAGYQKIAIFGDAGFIDFNQTITRDVSEILSTKACYVGYALGDAHKNLIQPEQRKNNIIISGGASRGEPLYELIAQAIPYLSEDTLNKYQFAFYSGKNHSEQWKDKWQKILSQLNDYNIKDDVFSENFLQEANEAALVIVAGGLSAVEVATLQTPMIIWPSHILPNGSYEQIIRAKTIKDKIGSGVACLDRHENTPKKVALLIEDLLSLSQEREALQIDKAGVENFGSLINQYFSLAVNALENNRCNR